MIIKMFNQGKGRSGPIVQYLLSEEKHEGYKPEVVSGNVELTKNIIDSTTISRKNKYTTGVISFREGEILTEAQQLGLIHNFERTFAPFPEENRINFLWIRHYDKGRLELHFLTGMTDLKTGLQYNISPPGKPNQNFYKAFQDIVNYKFGFNSVMHPDRKLKENEYRQLAKEAEGYYNRRKEYILKRYDSPKIIRKKGDRNGQKRTNKQRFIQSTYNGDGIKSKSQFDRASQQFNHSVPKLRAGNDIKAHERSRRIEEFASKNSYGSIGIGNSQTGIKSRNSEGLSRPNGGNEKPSQKAQVSTSHMSIDEKIVHLAKKLETCSIEEMGYIYEELGRLQAEKFKKSGPKIKF